MSGRTNSTRDRRSAGRPDRDRDAGGHEASQQKVSSRWEWVAAAVGAVLVAGTIGYMAYHAVTSTAMLPAVTIEPVAIEASGNGHVVRFRAENHSNATAATLLIEGELRQGPSVIETAETTLDYLPGYSERHGGLFFENDPTRYELRLTPKGYDEP